jgi:choline dehydrogenase-like flavoprotein
MKADTLVIGAGSAGAVIPPLARPSDPIVSRS